MKKCSVLLAAGFFAIAVHMTASAAEFAPTEYDAMAYSGSVLEQTEAECRVSYEWYNDERGEYAICLDGASSSGGTVTASLDGSERVTLADVGAQRRLTLDEGVHRFELFSSGGKLSVQKLRTEYLGAAPDGALHLESEEFTYYIGRNVHYEDYGSDMSEGNVDLFERNGDQAVTVQYGLCAPASGEYQAELTLSIVGVTYTSDLRMTVNGVPYDLKADTVTCLANLTNTSDPGLMKRYRMNNTVTLREGMNRIDLVTTELRDGNKHLFFLDCIDFRPAESTVVVPAGISGAKAGVYPLPAAPAGGGTRYLVDVVMSTSDASLPDFQMAKIGFSADGGTYTLLSKGSAENDFQDATAEVRSEYREDGVLHGVYRLKGSYAVGNRIYLQTYGEGCTVERLELTPGGGDGAILLTAKAAKTLLLPGESTEISLFARSADGYTRSVEQLRKDGMITFLSSDREILAVDATGKVTALQPGAAEVTVSCFDGQETQQVSIAFNSFRESDGFLVLDAQRRGDRAVVKLLAPYRTKSEGHIMIVASYDGTGRPSSIETVEVGALAQGQVTAWFVPAAEGKTKIISIRSFDSLAPIADVRTVREGGGT